MKRIPCTVGILTFNSAKTLSRALESIRDFDDIIICDGGSTDSTLTIAQEFGAQVIPQDARYKNPDGTLKDYGGARNQCLDAAKHDWFLYIDSDETISDELCEDIRRIVTASGEILVYRVPIGIMMDGRYLQYSSNYPGYQCRFFNRRSGARFIKEVHERISFDTNRVSVGTLTHPWYVHTTRDYWEHYLTETGSYRPIEIARSCAEPFSLKGYFYYTLWWHLRASFATSFKALRNYLLHGFKNAVPVRGELGRAVVPLIIIWKVTVCRFGRVLKFLTTGGIGLTVNLSVFHIFVTLGVPYLMGSIVALVIAMLVSFILQKYWTFEERTFGRTHRQFIQYALLALFNLGINTLIVYLSVEHLHVHYLIAQTIGAGMVAFTSYFTYKFYIFAKE